MRNLFIFIIVASVLGSCGSPQKLYDKGVKNIVKAIQQDSTLAFPTDTIRVTATDTIRGADGKDSIIRITNTIQVPCDFDAEALLEAAEEKSWRELRFERKESKDSIKHIQKMYKLETDRLKDSINLQKQANRQLTKQLDDQTDANVKLEKEKTKQKNGTWFTRFVGRNWMYVLLIGIVIGFFLRKILPKIPNPFKQNTP